MSSFAFAVFSPESCSCSFGREWALTLSSVICVPGVVHFMSFNPGTADNFAAGGG